LKFCSRCGSDRMVWRIPDDDNRPRHICDKCGEIFYSNPNIVAGCVPIWEDQILLCKRAIEPRFGWWTLPAGFMENGETTAEAAARETWEEACTRVDVRELYAIFNLPQINQVYMMFLAHMPVLEFAAGTESLECRLYSEDKVPWPELAFPTITHTLKFYFEDYKNGRFEQHFGDIIRDGQESVFLARRADADAGPA
jgi:ADP-ribose pyrophosphatase YjhB (NUDIX family)